MKNIKNLTKIYFLEILSSFANMFKNKNKSKASKVFSILMVLLLVGYLSFTIYMMYYNFALALQPYELQIYVFVIALCYFTLIMLLTIAFSVQGYFFKRKDFNLLGALPIKSYEIVVSKLVSLMLFSYIYELLFFAPVIAVFFVFGLANVVTTIYLIVGLIFIPFFTMLLSVILGLVLNFFSSRLKKNNAINLLLMVVFFVLIMVLFYFINLQLIGKIITIGGIPSYLYYLLPTNIPLFFSLQTGSLLWFLLFVASNALSLALAVILLTKAYKNLSKKRVRKTKFKENKTLTFRQRSPIKTLLLQEWKNYYNTTIYLFNTIFGMLILLFASVVAFILLLTKSEILTLFDKDTLFAIALILMAGSASLSITTNVSFSLEGNKLPIKKSLPISFKQIALSKYLLNMITMVPFMLVSYLFLVPLLVSFKAPLISYFVLLILPILLLSVFALFGLMLNLWFPKLQFTNETEVVKQSMSVMISIFSAMAFVGLVFPLYMSWLSKYLSIYNFSLIFIGVLIIINLLLVWLLSKKGQKIYKTL